MLVPIVSQLIVITEELGPKPVNFLSFARGIVVVHHFDSYKNYFDPVSLLFRKLVWLSKSQILFEILNIKNIVFWTATLQALLAAQQLV